ncbi:hypothetical protein LEP1GSC169_0638 [Leptospira santarosai str. HAI1349]|nr:hypothetical protein LEP1GSC169_0638 [Leptospira santarosai str. HAI1349]
MAFLKARLHVLTFETSSFIFIRPSSNTNRCRIQNRRPILKLI